jgi:hypothetical protein
MIKYIPHKKTELEQINVQTLLFLFLFLLSIMYACHTHYGKTYGTQQEEKEQAEVLAQPIFFLHIQGKQEKDAFYNKKG